MQQSIAIGGGMKRASESESGWRREEMGGIKGVRRQEDREVRGQRDIKSRGQRC